MILPPMNTLHTFVVATRRLNFSQASVDLNLTHAAVSTQIKKLEEWFGRRLFDRTPRGLVLTEAGEELARTVDNALLAISATSQNLRVTRDKRAISIACLPSVATRWLVPGLSDFMARQPNISVQLSYAEALKPFDRDRHDVLISHFRAPPPDVAAVRLFGRTSQPVASPVYVERSKAQLQNRLDGARLLHDVSVQPWEDWFVAADFRPTRVSHGPVFPDFNLLANAVMAGDGIALCPVEVFAREIARGDLVVLSDVATQRDEAYYMVTVERPPPAVSAFVTWFQQQCLKTAG